jgi:hypothetical protein
LREMLYSGRLKLFVEAWDLFKHAVFQHFVVRKTASSGCILQGAKDGSRRVLNRDCREGEGEQPTRFLQLPHLWTDLCAVCHRHAGDGLDSSYCLAESFEFHALRTKKFNDHTQPSTYVHSIRHFAVLLC